MNLMIDSDATPKPEESCALYVRRSSAAAGTNQKLKEQEAEARALAERKGLHVVAVFAEREGTGASARSRKKRPQWEAALAALDEGERFHTIVAYALDRADRRGADTLGAMLTRHATTKRRVITCDGIDTSDPQQRMNTIIRGEVAREYSERLGDNVARTKRYRREQGLWLGGKPPWGLRVDGDGRLEHDPETYPEARGVADKLLAGHTLWQVVKDLNERRVSPLPTGVEWGSTVTRKARDRDEDVESAPQHWRVSSLSTMVRSPSWAGLQGIRRRTPSGGYAGIADVYKSVDTGLPVSIGKGVVTPAERALILAHLDSRSTTEADRPRTLTGGLGRTGIKPSSALLGNRLQCPSCGGRATLSGRKGRQSYRCGSAAQGAARCEGFSCPADMLDDYVVSRVLIHLAGMEVTDPALAAVATVWAGEANPESQAERRAVEDGVRAAEADLARVRRLAVAGVLTEDEAAEELPRLREAVASARRALDELSQSTPIDASSLVDLQYAAEKWDNLATDAQRRIVEADVVRVVVSRAGRRGIRFDPYERAVITFRDGTTWPRMAA